MTHSAPRPTTVSRMIHARAARSRNHPPRHRPPPGAAPDKCAGWCGSPACAGRCRRVWSGACRGQRILAVERRAKYLLLRLEQGTLILHLGMSGSLRVLPATTPAEKHDHLDLLLGERPLPAPARPAPLRRRAVVRGGPPGSSPAAGAGSRAPGPRAQRRASAPQRSRQTGGGEEPDHGQPGWWWVWVTSTPARPCSGPHPPPSAPATASTLARYQRLAEAIRQILRQAIARGGTTLRDFSRADGSPGYFALSLKVYGKAGEPCPACAEPIRQRHIGQRSSFFCPRCQR